MIDTENAREMSGAGGTLAVCQDAAGSPGVFFYTHDQQEVATGRDRRVLTPLWPAGLCLGAEPRERSEQRDDQPPGLYWPSSPGPQKEARRCIGGGPTVSATGPYLGPPCIEGGISRGCAMENGGESYRHFPTKRSAGAGAGLTDRTTFADAL